MGAENAWDEGHIPSRTHLFRTEGVVYQAGGQVEIVKTNNPGYWFSRTREKVKEAVPRNGRERKILECGGVRPKGGSTHFRPCQRQQSRVLYAGVPVGYFPDN
jgi:hypothetical protein